VFEDQAGLGVRDRRVGRQVVENVMGGLVATTGDWAERLRQVRAITGGLLHPLAAYALHRGLQTLPVRVRAQQETAGKVAQRLVSHPSVERVFFPGLPECDPLGLVGRHLAGPGSVLAFEVTEGTTRRRGWLVAAS